MSEIKLYKAGIKSRIPAGTSFYGQTILATRRELQKLFGKPRQSSADGKYFFKWELMINSHRRPVTVYDYKVGKKLKMDKAYDWHIGGMDEDDTLEAVYLIEDKISDIRFK